jgi:hypothetical protein
VALKKVGRPIVHGWTVTAAGLLPLEPSVVVWMIQSLPPPNGTLSLSSLPIVRRGTVRPLGDNIVEPSPELEHQLGAESHHEDQVFILPLSRADQGRCRPEHKSA